VPLAVLIPNTPALWKRGFSPTEKAERDTKAEPVHHASVVEMMLFSTSVFSQHLSLAHTCTFVCVGEYSNNHVKLSMYRTTVADLSARDELCNED